MIIDNYTTDSSKSNDGVWFDHDGASFLVARYTKLAFINHLEVLKKPFAKRIAKGKFGIEDELPLIAKAMSEHILLDWKGVKTAEGKEIKYSKEIAEKFLSSPEAEEFRELISGFAENVDAFRSEAIEASGKK